MVQLVEFTTVTLFSKIPSANKLTNVPADKPQVPKTEVVPYVIVDVVITGAAEVPVKLY